MHQRMEAALQQRMREQGFKPTRAASLAQSLEDLLNGGYGIVSTSQTAGALGFTLKDQAGRKWVFCALERHSGDGQHQASASQCMALN